MIPGALVGAAVSAALVGVVVSGWVCGAAASDWWAMRAARLRGESRMRAIRRHRVAGFVALKSVCILSAQCALLGGALAGWLMDETRLIWPALFAVRQGGAAAASVALLAWSLIDAEFRRWADGPGAFGGGDG